MENIKSIIVSTNPQKVLDLFLNYPGKQLTEKEIQAVTKISKSGVNYALKDLIGSKTVLKEQKGKMFFYKLNFDDPVIKQMKVLKNIIYTKPLVKKLNKLSTKLILFGSSARGEDVEDSDIDLFVITNSEKEKVEEVVKRTKSKRKIQLIVRTELGHTELRHSDPVFYQQVQQGIVLWEKI
jgi:predicted nucleotidyltransferase